MKQLSDAEREELRRELAEYHVEKAKEVARNSDQQNRDFFGTEKKGIQKGVLGGLIMMAIAFVWFFGGLAVGFVFWYPLILFAIGVYAFVKGLVTGNISGRVNNGAKTDLRFFVCQRCGKDIVVEHLGPGETVKCRSCGAENVVPE